MTREMSRWAGWPAPRRDNFTGERLARLGQRGQALIEFAFVMIILMFLIAGVTDIATLLDLHESVVYAARQGARTGAVIGPVAGADCAIVGAIHSSLLNQPNFTLNTIYIYQATPGGGALADGSRGSALYDEYPGTSDCQVSGTTATIINSQTGALQPPLVNGWPPLQSDGVTPNRQNTPFTNDDSLGVELDFSYQFQLNVVGTGAFSAVDYAVFQMNPAALPTPAPTNTSGA